MTDPLEQEPQPEGEQLAAPKAEQLRFNTVLSAARWLAGSTFRRHPIRIAVVAIAQVFGALGTALGTVAVFFYIRAAVGDGTLGRINIEIETASEPGTASIFLISVMAVILLAAGAVWQSEKALAELARRQASVLREMLLQLIDDPLSKNWQDQAGFRRPTIELQQILIQRVRSMTIALTDVLSLAPALAVLLFSLGVALYIDALAALILLPFIAGFGLVSERINRRVQTLTATYESRQQRTRDIMAEQLDDLFTGRIAHEEVSLSRPFADDGLFHDRQLQTTKLRLLGLVSGAVLFALTAAFFIIFRGVENLSVEAIIAYIYAIRFATRSAEQILKALAQVSRRFEDMSAVSGFLEKMDRHRSENLNQRQTQPFTTSLTICHEQKCSEVRMGEPVIVLSDEPVDEKSAFRVLRILSKSADQSSVDLTEGARIIRFESDTPTHDVLGETSVRVLITDDPLIQSERDDKVFTFVMHNRPKVLLAGRVKASADDFGPAFVIQGGRIAWTGSVTEASEDSERIRELLRKRPNTKKARRSAANTSTDKSVDSALR